MEINQIKYAIAVYEQKNFTLAATTCHVAQPSLSKAIKQLETYLAGNLFIRGKGPIQPTPLGHHLYPLFKKIIDGTEQAYSLSNRLLSLKSVPICIGIESSIGSKFIIPALNHLKKNFPHLEFELFFDTQKQLTPRLESLNLDLMISPKTDYNPTQFTSTLLYQEDYHVVFHRDHPFNSRTHIPLNLLSQESYLDYISCVMRNDVLNYCTSHNISLYPSYRSESKEWILDLTAQKFGVCIMPIGTINHPQLTSCLLTRPKVKRHIYMTVSHHQKRLQKWPPISTLLNFFNTISTA